MVKEPIVVKDLSLVTTALRPAGVASPSAAPAGPR